MSKPNRPTASNAPSTPPTTAPEQAGDRPRFDLTAWRPSWKVAWWILGGVAAGVLLFALVWSEKRDDGFFRAEGTSPTAAPTDYEPLPVPSAVRRDGTNGLDPAAAERPDSEPDDTREQPRLVETAPPPPPVAPAAPPPPEAPAASGPASQPRPIAGRTPPPRYPNRALRRGDRGTVLVRAAIGPDGVPTSVEVAEGSGSRLLDRAAVDAVERWRFHPAMVDGQPTVGAVVVPISFEPSR